MIYKTLSKYLGEKTVLLYDKSCDFERGYASDSITLTLVDFIFANDEADNEANLFVFLTAVVLAIKMKRRWCQTDVFG